MVLKVTARDTIQRTLPVAEHIIDRHQKVLLDLGNAAREKRAKVSPPSFSSNYWSRQHNARFLCARFESAESTYFVLNDMRTELQN